MSAGIKEFIAGKVTFTAVCQAYWDRLRWALGRVKHWWIWTITGLFLVYATGIHRGHYHGH